MTDANTAIRSFQDQDEVEVVGVWHRAGQAAYGFLPTWQSFTIEQATEIFRKVIRAHCDIWVGTRRDVIVAYFAMAGSHIDRMYVEPVEWRQGWGTRFILFAKTLYPSGLEVHTHLANYPARRLYEKHEFKAVKFGMSPAPENAPDVEYHWRPGA